jgi:4a-hydroxytetrahydrobiopterin dehydratase
MIPPIDPAELETFLARHAGWSTENGALERTRRFSSFRDAIAFVNAVADVAEALGHHPDLHVHYDRVTLRIWTHSTGTLTRRDLDLAARLDRLA